MRPDNFEKFIKENRTAFDDLSPDPKMWDRINENKKPPKVVSINWVRLMRQVAAVIVIFIASYFFHDYMSKRENRSAGTREMARKSNSGNEVLQLLAETEAYYTSQIIIKKEEIFRFAGSNPDIKNEIDLEFSQLDTIYSELKNDLNDNAANEEVVEAMIQNYRIKLEILEEILHQLKKSNESLINETYEI
ncbi:MAG: hypothetical protein KAG99_11350 [Bacteroidales bacterium]|nr:hypothetical protein [Bacteroidales bacterium]